MKTFDLTQGEQTCAGLNAHPDALRLTMSQERAVQMLSQLANVLLCAMDGREPTVRLTMFGTWKERA